MFFDNFSANLFANLAAAFVIGGLAFLMRGSIGNYVKKLIRTIPELDLCFSDGKKTLEIAPSTKSKDYDISIRPIIENSGQTPFSAPASFLNIFIPKVGYAESFFSSNATDRDWEGKYRLFTIRLDKIPTGFYGTGLNYGFRITNPSNKEYKVYYYFQTPYGFFPKTFKIANHKEIPETGGRLTIKLLDT